MLPLKIPVNPSKAWFGSGHESHAAARRPDRAQVLVASDDGRLVVLDVDDLSTRAEFSTPADFGRFRDLIRLVPPSTRMTGFFHEPGKGVVEIVLRDARRFRRRLLPRATVQGPMNS